MVGFRVGANVGFLEGTAVGVSVGPAVGISVGIPVVVVACVVWVVKIWHIGFPVIEEGAHTRGEQQEIPFVQGPPAVLSHGAGAFVGFSVGDKVVVV